MNKPLMAQFKYPSRGGLRKAMDISGSEAKLARGNQP